MSSNVLRRQNADARQGPLADKFPNNDDSRPGHVLPRSNAAAADLVAFIKRARRLRDGFFSAELFGEPAWDIMLDLYESALFQRRLSIHDVCVGSGVPPTTTARWLNALESNGFICRRPDPLDGRRIFISLTDAALSRLDGLFATIEKS